MAVFFIYDACHLAMAHFYSIFVKYTYNYQKAFFSRLADNLLAVGSVTLNFKGPI